MMNIFYDFVTIFCLIGSISWTFLSNYFFALCTMQDEISTRSRKLFCNNYPAFYFLLLFFVSCINRVLEVVGFFLMQNSYISIFHFQRIKLINDSFIFNYYKNVFASLVFFLGACVVCHIFNEMYNEIFCEYYFHLRWFTYIYYIQSVILFPIYFMNWITYFFNVLLFPSKNKIESQDVISRTLYIYIYNYLILNLVTAVFKIVFVFFDILIFLDNYFFIKENKSFDNVVLRVLLRLSYFLYCIYSIFIGLGLCFMLFYISINSYDFPVVFVTCGCIVITSTFVALYVFFQEYRMRAFNKISYWLN